MTKQTRQYVEQLNERVATLQFTIDAANQLDDYSNGKLGFAQAFKLVIDLDAETGTNVAQWH